jgi:hypothetical protein
LLPGHVVEVAVVRHCPRAQLFAILALKTFLKTDYRGVVKPVVEQLAAAVEPSDATLELNAPTGGHSAVPAGRTGPTLEDTG